MKPSPQGLTTHRRSDWVAGFQQGIVKVSVADVRVEHQVKLTDFTKWLERAGRSPREVIQRQRIRFDTWDAGLAIARELRKRGRGFGDLRPLIVIAAWIDSKILQ